MLHTAYRPLYARLIGFGWTLLPGLAFAEVSDKEPSLWFIWVVGLAASGLCMAAMAHRRWLGAVLAVLPALWFAGLLMEIHSPDVGPYLYAEQGWSYYLQVYLVLTVFVASLVLGLRLHAQRRQRPRDATATARPPG